MPSARFLLLFWAALLAAVAVVAFAVVHAGTMGRVMTVSLDALVQAFRLPKAKRSGSREEKARQLSCNAMYAMHHPHLCDDMPHRFFPVRADDALCIRCGALERWP